MQKIKKLIAVFLAILVVVSIFSIDASAAFIGTGSNIGSAPINPSNYNTPVLNNTQSSVVGYRFSIVDTTGETVVSNNKFKTIDLIRTTLPSNDKNNVYAYADGAGGEGSLTTKKMRVRNNKYQWNKLYRSGGDIDITRVTSKGSAGTNTYGLKYVTDIGAGDLPYTTGVETWTNTVLNRSKLLNALGYSTTTSNVDSVLGRNRIVIEPLFRVKWDGAWTLFSACDLAIMNCVYFESGNSNFPNGTGEKNGRYGQYKDANTTSIRRFTNGLYQESLCIGTDKTNLKMPSDAPLTHVSAKKNPSVNKIQYLWTYDQIIKSTLGMAIYYNIELELQSKTELEVLYYSKLGSAQCSTTSNYYHWKNDGLILNKDGTILKQIIPADGTNANGLVNSLETLKLSAPDGYHWNVDKDGHRTWRFYSYNSPSESPRKSYWLVQSDSVKIASAKGFWQAVYHDTTNVQTGSGTVSEGWRYAWSGKQKTDLVGKGAVFAHPDISPNKLTIAYHSNFGPIGFSKPVTKYYNDNLFYLKDNIYFRLGYKLIGWSFSKTATKPDFILNAPITSAQYFANRAGKLAAFKKGDIEVDLYAVWEKASESRQLTIKYDSNGGVGETDDQVVGGSEAVTLKDNTTFTKYGYNLVGWDLVPEKVLGVERKYHKTAYSYPCSKSFHNAKYLTVKTDGSDTYFEDLINPQTEVTLKARWEKKTETTAIKVKINPDIIAPTQFVSEWDNPLESQVLCCLMRDGKILSQSIGTISSPFDAATIEALEYGDYTLYVLAQPQDSYLEGTVDGVEYKGRYIEVPITCDGTTQEFSFDLKNHTHTIEVDYHNQFNEQYDKVQFRTTMYKDGVEFGSIVYGVDSDGRASFRVPACGKYDKGSVPQYSYVTVMENTPDNYAPDTRAYDTGDVDCDSDTVHKASFENWYIWDFGITAEPSASIVNRGQTFNVNLSAKNGKPKTNVPEVTVEVIFDSEIIKTFTLTIDGNSAINETVPVSVPEDAELGSHTVSVNINYDKYFEKGNDWLYEENMEDNEASFEVGVEKMSYTLSVIYHSNDGTGQTLTDKFIWGEDVITKGGIFTWDGYMFEGWALAPDSNTVTYTGNTNIGKAEVVDPNLATKNCTLNLYAVWSKIEEPQDGSIIIDVSSVVTAPTQFADKWNNPEGRYSVVTLSLNGEVKATKNITIPKSGGPANTVTFANMAVGTYKVEITVPTKDCYYDKNGETAATVTLEHTGLQTRQSFVLKNNTHTVNITYTNQFDEHLNDAVFTTTIYKDGKPVGTVSLKPTPDGKLSFTVPACDPDGHIYTYSTVMDKAPTNYSKDTSKHTIDGFVTNASTHADMSFKSWYIWDFSVTTALSDTSQAEYQGKGGFERGETIDVIVSSRNARSHRNSPEVTVEVFFDNQRIETKNLENLTINANSELEFTVPVTIPADVSLGAHRITAYINYDKYSQYGTDYLYETAVADNTSILDFIVADGDIMITPVALNGTFCINDTVFASFYVYNNGLKDVLTENGAKVEATLFYTAIDGTDKSVVLDTFENVVIPNYNYIDNRNLVYFKFVIPDDAKIDVNCAVMATVDGGTAFDTDESNNTAAIIRTVNWRMTSNTPDYGRALNTPRGMLNKCGIPNLTKYAEKSTSSVVGNIASWNEWVEESPKTLKLHSYGVKANLDAVVKIDNRCLTAAFEDGDLVLKSGYAITLAVQPVIEATSGVTEAMYGKYNAANAYYPEYGYAKEGGKYSTLQFLGTDADRSTSQFTDTTAFADRANTHDVPILASTPRWELPQCTFSSFYYRGSGMARKHFTPLWWKDGRYTIVCDATELWTPAGMVGAEAVAHSGQGGDVYISGSVYDNYYTARG